MSGALRPFVDRILQHADPAITLDDFLVAAKRKGESNETIARRLHAEHDVEVATETVRTWVNDLPAEVAS